MFNDSLKEKKIIKNIFKIDVTKEEEKHKKTLSHFLEKLHKANEWQNKDVAEILDIDKGTYSKIRNSQIAPLTNSIITLKRFAYLNDSNIIDFISKIEEIKSEVKGSDWLIILNTIMQDSGDLIRRELIHNRLSDLLKNDPEYSEKLKKCFVLLIILIDLLKHEKWFNFCSNLIIKVHNNIGIKKTLNLEALISRIKIRTKK